MTNTRIDNGIDSKTLPTFLFSFIVSVLQEQGIRSDKLLQGTAISREEINNEKTRISYRQALILIENALSLSSIQALGLTIGSKQPLSTWGMLGYALSSCKTLLDATRIGLDYHPIATNLINSSMKIEDNVIVLQYETSYNTGKLLPFIIEEAFSSHVSLGRDLSHRNITPLAINFSYDPPVYKDAYRSFFQCPMNFNQPNNQLILDRKEMETPLPSYNPITERLALKLCNELLREEQQHNSILNKVRQQLLKAPGNFPSMKAVANELGISDRQLRRQLKLEDTSFQSIFDDVREKIAIEYLKVSSLPLEDIAYLAGFSEVSAFNRAFKRWTGQSPSRYR